MTRSPRFQAEGRDRWLSQVHGVLAGNVFDWGAKAVRQLYEKGDLSFNSALSKIKGRKVYHISHASSESLSQTFNAVKDFKMILNCLL